MTEKRKERKNYPKEFKEETAKSIVEGRKNVRAVSRELEISENVLHRWKNDYISNKENAFPGKGKMRPTDEENQRIKKENAELRMECEILKKALAIFSRQSK